MTIINSTELTASEPSNTSTSPDAASAEEPREGDSTAADEPDTLPIQDASAGTLAPDDNLTDADASDSSTLPDASASDLSLDDVRSDSVDPATDALACELPFVSHEVATLTNRILMFVEPNLKRRDEMRPLVEQYARVMRQRHGSWILEVEIMIKIQERFKLSLRKLHDALKRCGELVPAYSAGDLSKRRSAYEAVRKHEILRQMDVYRVAALARLPDERLKQVVESGSLNGLNIFTTDRSIIEREVRSVVLDISGKPSSRKKSVPAAKSEPSNPPTTPSQGEPAVDALIVEMPVTEFIEHVKLYADSLPEDEDNQLIRSEFTQFIKRIETMARRSDEDDDTQALRTGNTDVVGGDLSGKDVDPTKAKRRRRSRG